MCKADMCSHGSGTNPNEAKSRSCVFNGKRVRSKVKGEVTLKWMFGS